MKKTIFAILAAILWVNASHVQASSEDLAIIKSSDEDLTVVELFTTQSCPNCPPADDVLTFLSSRSDLLTLSWPVDHLNRLGWADTFSDPLFSRRHKAYNRRFGRSIYTPQMVLNGRAEVVGSRRSEVTGMIKNHTGELTLKPVISLQDSNIEIALPSTSLAEEAAIRLVWFRSSASVDVKRGANEGRRLRYTNIVRKSDWVDDWDGDVKVIKLPLASLEEHAANAVAVIVHSGYGDGPIIGAANAFFGPAEDDEKTPISLGR